MARAKLREEQPIVDIANQLHGPGSDNSGPHDKHETVNS